MATLNFIANVFQGGTAATGLSGNQSFTTGRHILAICYAQRNGHENGLAGDWSLADDASTNSPVWTQRGLSAIFTVDANEIQIAVYTSDELTATESFELTADARPGNTGADTFRYRFSIYEIIDGDGTIDELVYDDHTGAGDDWVLNFAAAPVSGDAQVIAGSTFGGGSANYDATLPATFSSDNSGTQLVAMSTTTGTVQNESYGKAGTQVAVAVRLKISAAGDITVNVGLASETDTGLPVTVSLANLDVATGQASEVDSALPVTVSLGTLVVPVGLATETNTALPVTIVTSGTTVNVGLASETDSALPVSVALANLDVPVGLASEANTALPVTAVFGSTTVAVGIATENDSALAVTVVSSAEATIAVGIAIEIDTALPVYNPTVMVGIATERDIATPVGINVAVPNEEILSIDDWINSPPEWGQEGSKTNDWMNDLADIVRQIKRAMEQDGALLWSHIYEFDVIGGSNTTLVPLPQVMGNGDDMPRFGFPTTMVIEVDGSHGINDSNADAAWLIKDQFDGPGGDVIGNLINRETDTYQSLDSAGEWTVLRLRGRKHLASGEQGRWSAGYVVSVGSYDARASIKVSMHRGHIGKGVALSPVLPVSHQVAYRTITGPATKSPTVTPTLAEIEHPSGGTIYAGGSGTTHTITTEISWNTATAAAAPGDILKITAAITVPLVYRGDKYGITGGSSADGAAGNPIVLAREGSGKIDVTSINNSDAALEIFNCDHVWCVEMETEGSQFGIYYRNSEGTVGDPVRVAHSTLTNSGDAALSIAGWFQLITSSGGTAPTSGASPTDATAYTWGFSQHFIVEGNTITGPGLNSPSTGECVYLGAGSVAASWGSFAENVLVRHNLLEDCTSDYVDIKPGCAKIQIVDNIMRLGHFISGAAIQCLYVTSALDDRPSWYNYDPEIVVEGNRIYDGDLTNTDASSSHFVFQTSLCGVLFANNQCWGFPNGGVGFRLRSEKPASQSQVGSEKWVVVNNLFWMDNGLQNSGAPLTSPVAFSSALIDERNNLGPTGASGVQHTATSSDFIDSAAIPTVDTVDADAEWETYGPGSAFDLDLASALVGAGTSIADLTLFLDEDITQRDIPSASPAPGPFQVFV